MRVDPAAFDRLDKAVLAWSMMNKPDIKVKLTPWNRYWKITFEEDFGLTDDAGVRYNTSELDNRVKWADEQLQSWPNVSRQSWQDWRFMKKADAEKFITLHTLVWAQ